MAVSLIKRQAYRNLAAWIASEHPELFNGLATLAIQQRTPTRAQIAGFGDVTLQDISFDPGSIAMPDFSSAIDASLFDAWTPDPNAPDINALVVDPNSLSSPYSSGSPGSPGAAGGNLSDQLSAGFTPFQLDTSLVSAPVPEFNAADLTGGGSGGGFFSSIGNAVSSVGDFLTSKTGLAAMAGLATAVFTTQAQGQVLQAQAQRAQNGANPAAVQYVRNAAGQLVPAYTDPRTGQLVPVTSARQLTTAGSVLPASLTALLPALLLGGGVIVIISLLMRRRAS